MKSSWGGKRRGAGKPKGRKSQTPAALKRKLSKEEAREHARTIITVHLEELIASQISHAKGLSYLVARHKTTGKFAKLTEAMALAIASGENPEYQAIEVWTKDPSVQAFEELMDRALDKPAQQVEVAGKDGGPITFKWQD